jgi:asparagine synthase (glutamine-hydrolysing)
MCGIAGLILSPGASPPTPDVLARLIDTLHHRGPDGTGQHVLGRIALVHNRLAIIDLVTGDQPFTAGAATLVANG